MLCSKRACLVMGLAQEFASIGQLVVYIKNVIIQGQKPSTLLEFDKVSIHPPEQSSRRAANFCLSPLLLFVPST